jgi:hypothetical protein
MQIDASCRTATYLGLIQAGVVAGGTLLVTGMLKVYGYENYDITGFGIVFSQTALFIRYHGYMLMTLPLVWAALAVASLRSGKDWFAFIAFSVGLLAIVLGIFGYITIAMHPFERAPMRPPW